MERRTRGRPSFNIDLERVRFYRSLNFRWSDIAHLLGCHRSTLYAATNSLREEEDQNHISDDQLLNVMEDVLRRTPHLGETYVIGALRARGVQFTRVRVRKCLDILDAEGREERRRHPIERRVYEVRGPNHLWHMDGNHKLISYRFVYHACVDGYSRKLIYLHCSQDNTAGNELSYFLEAIRTHGVPSRVRGDHGGENYQVAEYMIRARGLNRGSYIAGPSVHNTRIERLWRELNRVVTKQFKMLFRTMKKPLRILSEFDEVDLAALSYVYLPRIRDSMRQFIDLWNMHGLSTENGFTPCQLYLMGEEPRPVPPIDDFQPSDLGFVTNNNVVVPRSKLDLTPQILQEMYLLVPDPLVDDGNSGINFYLLIRDLLCRFFP